MIPGDLAPAPAAGEFLVNTFTDDAQSQATVSALSGGGFVVVWASRSTAIAGQTILLAGIGESASITMDDFLLT